MINVEQQLLFTLKDATAGIFFFFLVVLNQHEIPCVLHYNSPISKSIHTVNKSEEEVFCRSCGVKEFVCRAGGRKWPHYSFAPAPSKRQTDSLYTLAREKF